MDAPIPDDLRAFGLHRVRCECRTENLVVFPEPWYRFQESTDIELSCLDCGRSLRPMSIPVGAEARQFGLGDLPINVASRISSELAAEVTEHQDTPAEDIDLSPSAWTRPHQASAAYAAWVDAQPAPVPDHTARIENAVATAVLVAVVAISLLF